MPIIEVNGVHKAYGGRPADGVAAVELTVRLDPDVVLTALRMPGGGVAAITEPTRLGARSRVLGLTTYKLGAKDRGGRGRRLRARHPRLTPHLTPRPAAATATGPPR